MQTNPPLCPKCHKGNPETALFCSHCGQKIKTPPPPPPRAKPKVNRFLKWTLLVVAVIWAGVMLAWYYISQQNPLGMAMVIVPRGCFQMGSTESDRESPVHEVCLSWFYMGKYEVTQKQWEIIMGSHPPLRECGEDCPVTNVSSAMIHTFIDKLNKQGFGKYRLPTEAEWEYACRGGARQRFCGGDDADPLAWYRNNSQQRLHPVGQKAANGFGLHDMNGNAWEWVADYFNETYYAKSPKDNPKGAAVGSLGIFRGGSHNSSQSYLRPTLRNIYDPTIVFEDVGFRLVREP